ncbi:hypothetical protein CXG81DRAFT_16596 [Caulochytrium protostelioides]|uniref:Uncharacterized protein n=1 Tax=Caulochytrium protostelioides TaxID=1555241 RepID=A0A4P9XEF0_9FUNG|nr:hypothetical protein CAUPRSCDRAFT_11016 [Caulochytrium protostelioides]RKP03888.1 hypothetical protein CXG81DRAFT_16596 [Caulochytrium protostelioides]|eukprot:RKP03888.1 hypothetical protein CXG81DRAFT_16596 [Caulochytrium protostelioides]
MAPAPASPLRRPAADSATPDIESTDPADAGTRPALGRSSVSYGRRGRSLSLSGYRSSSPGHLRSPTTPATTSPLKYQTSVDASQEEALDISQHTFAVTAADAAAAVYLTAMPTVTMDVAFVATTTTTTTHPSVRTVEHGELGEPAGPCNARSTPSVQRPRPFSMGREPDVTRSRLTRSGGLIPRDSNRTMSHHLPFHASGSASMSSAAVMSLVIPKPALDTLPSGHFPATLTQASEDIDSLTAWTPPPSGAASLAQFEPAAEHESHMDLDGFLAYVHSPQGSPSASLSGMSASAAMWASGPPASPYRASTATLPVLDPAGADAAAGAAGASSPTSKSRLRSMLGRPLTSTSTRSVLPTTSFKGMSRRFSRSMPANAFSDGSSPHDSQVSVPVPDPASTDITEILDSGLTYMSLGMCSATKDLVLADVHTLIEVGTGEAWEHEMTRLATRSPSQTLRETMDRPALHGLESHDVDASRGYVRDDPVGHEDIGHLLSIGDVARRQAPAAATGRGSRRGRSHSVSVGQRRSSWYDAKRDISELCSLTSATAPVLSTTDRLVGSLTDASMLSSAPPEMATAAPSPQPARTASRAVKRRSLPTVSPLRALKSVFASRTVSVSGSVSGSVSASDAMSESVTSPSAAVATSTAASPLAAIAASSDLIADADEDFDHPPHSRVSYTQRACGVTIAQFGSDPNLQAVTMPDGCNDIDDVLGGMWASSGNARSANLLLKDALSRHLAVDPSASLYAATTTGFDGGASDSLFMHPAGVEAATMAGSASLLGASSADGPDVGAAAASVALPPVPISITQTELRLLNCALSDGNQIMGAPKLESADTEAADQAIVLAAMPNAVMPVRRLTNLDIYKFMSLAELHGPPSASTFAATGQDAVQTGDDAAAHARDGAGTEDGLRTDKTMPAAQALVRLVKATRSWSYSMLPRSGPERDAAMLGVAGATRSDARPSYRHGSADVAVGNTGARAAAAPRRPAAGTRICVGMRPALAPAQRCRPLSSGGVSAHTGNDAVMTMPAVALDHGPLTPISTTPAS